MRGEALPLPQCRRCDRMGRDVWESGGLSSGLGSAVDWTWTRHNTTTGLSVLPDGNCDIFSDLLRRMRLTMNG